MGQYGPTRFRVSVGQHVSAGQHGSARGSMCGSARPTCLRTAGVASRTCKLELVKLRAQCNTQLRVDKREISAVLMAQGKIKNYKPNRPCTAFSNTPKPTPSYISTTPYLQYACTASNKPSQRQVKSAPSHTCTSQHQVKSIPHPTCSIRPPRLPAPMRHARHAPAGPSGKGARAQRILGQYFERHTPHMGV